MLTRNFNRMNFNAKSKGKRYLFNIFDKNNILDKTAHLEYMEIYSFLSLNKIPVLGVFLSMCHLFRCSVI